MPGFLPNSANLHLSDVAESEGTAGSWPEDGFPGPGVRKDRNTLRHGLARWRLLAKASLSVSRVSHHQAFASVLSPAGVVGAVAFALLDSGTVPRKKPAKSLMSDGIV